MKKIYKNLVNGSFLGVALLLGATACSDDHFDVKDQSGLNGGNATIWESIESNPDLSDAAEILKASRVMKDEKDKKATLYYSEWLDQPMEVTAWLPKNGTFDKQHYLDMLDKAKALASADSLTQSLKLEFQVVTQFVRNHIALFNYGNSVTKQQVRLLNSKLCVYDASKCEFNGRHYDAQATTHNSNGVLHVLTDGASPFSYNIYDFMSSDADFSTVYGVISDPAVDKNVFWPEGSTEGAMNEKGEIVYVDSVYRNTNELLSRANALIKNEDSIYVAFIPTNEAWKPTFEVVKPLFNYGSSYCYDWDEDKFTKVGSNALKFNTDSLRDASASAQIIESMFFNPTQFAANNGIDKTDSTQLINYMVNVADSLISTNGVVFYNSNAGTGLPNPMFAGLKPFKASNGYVFAPSDCRIVPELSYVRRSEVRPTGMLASFSGQSEMITLTADNWNKEIVKGEVQDDWYNYFEMIGNNTMRIKMRLQNLASGHYKISAQMLPNRINKFKVKYENDGITPIEEKPLFDDTIYGDDNKRI